MQMIAISTYYIASNVCKIPWRRPRHPNQPRTYTEEFRRTTRTEDHSMYLLSSRNRVLAIVLRPRYDDFIKFFIIFYLTNFDYSNCMCKLYFGQHSLQ